MVQVKLLSPALRERHGARSLERRADRVDELLAEIGVEPDLDLRVLVNGRATTHLAGLETELADSDVVSIYYAGIRGFPGG